MNPTGNLLFGVGSLHHLPFRSQRLRLLHQALDMGFRNFDVAPAYGNGLNELELGGALAGYRSTCQVTTKFGIPSHLYGARFPSLFRLIRAIRILSNTYGSEYRRRIFSAGEMVRSLHGSLKRLKRDYIDDFMIHEPVGILTRAEVVDLHEMASRLKQQGKILRWGVAGPQVSIGQFMGDPMIDVVQLPLEEIPKLSKSTVKRKIAYGVYRCYLALPSPQRLKFTTYVRTRLLSGDADLVLATTASRTLASFEELFR